MKHVYQGHFVAWVFVLCLIFIPQYQVHAQQANGVHQKVFRVKFKENFIHKLEKAPKKKTAEGWVQTGHDPIDQLNKKYGISSMKRVFPDGGKWEQKHRKWGLHLWYELELEEGTKTLTARSSFSKLVEVSAAELVYDKYTGVESMAVRRAAALGALPNLSNDPQLNAQWHYHNSGQDGGMAGADIRLQDAWQIETGNSGVIVAVIDGGIDVNHSDLAANMWRNTAEIPGNGIDDDNNGYIDDIWGYNFGDGNPNIPADLHGTHVGGTVAAVTNNGNGVAGVAGGSGMGDGARLMSLSTFGQNFYGGFDQAFIYAADNGAVIAQNSWGYTSPGVYEQSVLEAIDYFIAEAGYDHNGNPRGPMQGGIVIFAAGNSGYDSEWYPAYYEPVFAVAATDRRDQPAYFSNYGSWVELAAPGVDVYSTMPGNSYGSLSGTSMACPHVSGVAALIISKFAGSITPQKVKSHLLAGTDALSTLPPGFGAGRLNAATALQENDGQPPLAVTDLGVTATYSNGLQLSWTAPSDPGNGKASAYQIRYSTTPITEANFGMASLAAGAPPAAAAGTAQSFVVGGLQPSTIYYLALKAADGFGNTSGLSNLATGTTQTAPALSVTPTSLEVEIDASSGNPVSRTITLANTGRDGSFLDFSFFSHYDGAIVSYDPSAGRIAAGASAEVTVSFNPNNLHNGSHYIELMINSNDPDNPTHFIPVQLYVNGQGPRIVVENTSLHFDSAFVGSNKGLPVIIRNLGMEYLYIHEISSSDAAFVPETNNIELWPQGETAFYVHFVPTEAGEKRATLSLHSNDPNQPVVELQLTGSAMAPPLISLTPANFELEINVSDKPVATRTLTIANDGAATLNFELLSYWSNHVVSFSPTTGSIAAGASAEVEVTFNAAYLPNGEHHIDIMVYNNDPLNSYIYLPASLTVNGQTPALYVETPSLQFDSVFVGSSTSQILYIRNTGMEQLLIHNISSSDPAFSTDAGSIMIYPYGDAYVNVTFSPAEAGEKQATLSLGSNDPNQPLVEIMLAGRGIEPPVIAVSPGEVSTSLNSGETASEMLTISNTGNSPLSYSFPAFVVHSLLKNPSVPKNNTAPVTVSAAYRARDKNSKEAEPSGHPVVMGAGSDMAYGYTWIDSDAQGGPSFVWEDISASGTEIMPGQDDNQEDVALPFIFNFYGEAKNSVRISTNGFLTFGWNGYSYTNEPIPAYWEPNDLIAAYWDDLRPYERTGQIFYQASPQGLIVQYQQVGTFSGNGTITFQIKLLPNGSIYFYYKDVNSLEYNNSATIGIENAAATDGMQIVFNNSYAKNNLAVMISPPGPGFITGVSQSWGTIPANSSQEVSVSLSAAGLNDGTYQNYLLIKNNDPLNSLLAVPFALNVTGAPFLQAEADSLAFGHVPLGISITRALRLKNTGSKEALISSISTATDLYQVTLDSTVTSLAPGSELTVPVSFTPTALGLLKDTLTIVSNGSGDEPLKIALFGEGVLAPAISVSPAALYAQLAPGQTAFDTIYVANQGQARLDFTLSTSAFSGPASVAKNSAAALAAAETAPGRGQKDLRAASVAPAGGGTDAGFTYNWLDNRQGNGPGFNWTDISSSGIDVTEALRTGSFADGATEVPLPFGFSFYEGFYGSVNISASGILYFEEAAGITFINQRIPVADNNNNLIAGMWQDLEPGTIGGTVHYQSTPESFTVQYTDVQAYGSFGGSATFQVILYPDGKIKMQYLDVATAGFAGSTTVGIENKWGTDGIQVVFNSPYLQNGLAIEFAKTNNQYTVEPGQKVPVPVVINATGLGEGTYSKEIYLASNDVLNPLVTVPLSLQVSGQAQMEVWPPEMNFGYVYVHPDSVFTGVQYAFIRNTGTSALLISEVYLQDTTEFNIQFWGPVELSPQTDVAIPVTFSPKTAGYFQTRLVIESSDALNSTYSIPVYGEGYSTPEFSANTTDTLVARLKSTETGHRSIAVQNTGGSYLTYNAHVTDIDASLARAIAKPALAQLQPARAHARLSFEGADPQRAGISQMNASSIKFTDSLYHESSNYADGFIGSYDPWIPMGIATGFVSPAEGFTLSHVHNFYRTDGSQNAIFMVVYIGGSSPATATSAYWYYVSGGSTEGDFQLIGLDEPIGINPGENFWINFFYPQQIGLAQGVNHSTDEMEGIYWTSFDYGTSWTPLENSWSNVRPKVRAMQSSSKWITLYPATAGLAPGETTQLQLNMNAAMVESGTHYASINFITNDPMQRNASIPVKVQVNSLPQFQQHNTHFTVNANAELEVMLKVSDADGGPMKYFLQENHANASIATMAEGAMVRFKPNSQQQGMYTFTMEAMDDMEEKAFTSFTVEVMPGTQNHAPVVVKQIKQQNIRQGKVGSIDLSGVFRDQDGDALSYTVAAGNPALAGLVIQGKTLWITALLPGNTLVNVVASDGRGGLAGTSFELKISGGKKDDGKGAKTAAYTTDDAETADPGGLVNYPNPFRGETTIAYALKEPAYVKLQVFNALGLPVSILADGQQEAGVHKITFDGSGLPAGIYLYRLQVADRITTKRMVVK